MANVRDDENGVPCTYSSGVQYRDDSSSGYSYEICIVSTYDTIYKSS